MRHSPIFLKLYAGFSVVILLSILIVGLMVQRQIEQASLRDISNNLTSQAFILQQSFNNIGEQTQSQIQHTVEQIGHLIETRVTLVSKEGVVIADSEFGSKHMDNHLNWPEIMAATTSEIGQSRRYSETHPQPKLRS